VSASFHSCFKKLTDVDYEVLNTDRRIHTGNQGYIQATKDTYIQATKDTYRQGYIQATKDTYRQGYIQATKDTYRQPRIHTGNQGRRKLTRTEAAKRCNDSQ